jgi:uncharacterized membrane-anchored protein
MTNNKSSKWTNKRIFIYALSAYYFLTFVRLAQGSYAFAFDEDQGILLVFLLFTAFVIGPFLWAAILTLYWLFIRWIASTAEKSGRSYVGFMLLAIFLPLLAWIIVLTFKKSHDL